MSSENILQEKDRILIQKTYKHMKQLEEFEHWLNIWYEVIVLFNCFCVLKRVFIF